MCRKNIRKHVCRTILTLLVALIAPGLFAPGALAQVIGPDPTQPAIALSPAVIMVKAQANASSTHVLTISNMTRANYRFYLEAYDVVIAGGRRTFIPAGETPDGIARSAIFDPPALDLPPGISADVKITLTIPPAPSVRAVAAVFHGQTAVPGRDGLMVTGSLGALITYNLSDELSFDIAAPTVALQTEASNLTVTTEVSNTGHEPAIPKGSMAILSSVGKLVGRVPIESHRLLPGEHFNFAVEYPHALKGGDYRAMLAFEADDGNVHTTNVAFAVP
jgi:hypothetical protein